MVPELVGFLFNALSSLAYPVRSDIFMIVAV